MTRVALIVAVAVFSFSVMVVAATSLANAEARDAVAVQSPERAAADWERNQFWPAPQPPFDKTPITPVESAGAPMCW